MHNRWFKISMLALLVSGLGVGPVLPLAGAQTGGSGSTLIAAAGTGVAAPVLDARASTAPTTATTALSLPRGVRGVRPATVARGAAGAATGPGKGPNASLLANFNGVSSADSATTNFGAEFEPPDQGLCVGNGFVLEPVNSAYRIYDTSGHSLAGPFNVNDLYKVGAADYTSDPRCFYDTATNTWFATILYIATTSSGFGTTSDLLVAVSQSGDPRGSWTHYTIDTTDTKNKGCGPKLGGCFGDQPTLGIDHNNLYVTTNEFGITSNTVNSAQIYAFAKSDLIAGSLAHYAFYNNLHNADGSPAYSVQPAISTGSTAAEYFLDSLDPNGTGDDRVGVWALTNGAVVASGGTPTLSTMIISSDAYAIPPGASQEEATSLIDGGDDRMQQTQYINGAIWGELDTAINIPGDSAPRAAAYWLSVRPTVSSGRLAGASMVQQGYVAQAGAYVLYPALQVDAQGHGAMVFTLTGSALYPSAAYAALAPGGVNFGPPRVVASGTGPYDPNATRWGDYSFAATDPTRDAFWLATEYVPPVSSQTPDRATNWGTRVFEVGAG